MPSSRKKRGIGRAKVTASRRKQLFLEPLEPRQMLAADLWSLQLVNDTGESSTDRITTDPRVTGSVVFDSYGGYVNVQFDHQGDGYADGYAGIWYSGQTFTYDPREWGLSSSYVGTLPLRYRLMEYDSYGYLLQSTSWSDFTITLDAPRLHATLTNLHLVTDDGEDPSDKVTSDPRLAGTVSWSGGSGYVQVQFDHQNDGYADGYAGVWWSGSSFTYDPREWGMSAGQTGTVPMRYRLVELDSYGNLIFTGSWESFSYQLETPRLNATLSNLHLMVDSGESSSDRITSDPRLEGYVSWSGSSGYVQVQFDHNSDGYGDGYAGVWSSGSSFTYDPRYWGLPANYTGVLPMRYRLVEFDSYGNQLFAGTWQEFEYELEAPRLNATLSNLRLVWDNGESSTDRVTTDPRLTGEVSWDGYGGWVQVEFDHFGDGYPDGYAGVWYSGSNFTYDPRDWGLSSYYTGALPLRYRLAEYDSYGSLLYRGSWTSFAIELFDPNAAPEIEVHALGVMSGVYDYLYDGMSSVAFGSTLPGQPVIRTLRIRNTGSSTLTLDPQSVSLPVGYSLVGEFPASVAPQSETTFQIRFDAPEAGSYYGELSFTSNDSDESPFNIFLSGTATLSVPEIEVLDPEGQPIAANQTVSLGTTTMGAPLDRMFTIQNVGSGELLINAWSIQLPAGFTMLYFPSSSVAAQGYTTFMVRLDASMSGEFGGTVQIASNDADEAVFSFQITGVVNAAPPEIEVYGDSGQPLSSGSGAINFGSFYEGQTQYRSFEIRNLGFGRLLLDASSVQLPAGYQILGSFPSSVEPYSSAWVTISLSGSAAGSYSGNLTFNTNDADEATYSIALSGAVLATEPELRVEDLNGQEFQGGVASLQFGATDFGLPITKSILVRNTGSAVLYWNRSQASVSGFTLLTEDLALAPGSAAYVHVRFDAPSPGVFGGDLTFSTNDADEPTFTVQVSAMANDRPASVSNVHLVNDTGFSSNDRTTSDPRIQGTVATVSFGVATVDIEFDHNGNGTVDGVAAGLSVGSVFTYDPRISDPAFVPSDDPLPVRYRVVQRSPNGAILSTGEWIAFTITLVEPETPEIAVLDADHQPLAAVALGTVNLGEPVAFEVVIDNSGAGPLELELDSTLLGPFQVVGMFPTVIGPQQQAVVMLRLPAQQVGSVSAALAFTTNDADEDLVVIPLTANVIIPPADIELSSNGEILEHGSTVDFGVTYIGFSTVLHLMVHNRGGESLHLTPANISLPVGFTWDVPLIATTVPPGAAAMFSIKFNASEPGVVTGDLIIPSDDPDEPLYTVTLTARAYDFEGTPGDSSGTTTDLQLVGLQLQGGQLSPSSDGYAKLPSVAGEVVATAGIAVSQVDVEYDIDGDGLADGSVEVAANGTFSVPLNERWFTEGPVIVRVRAALFDDQLGQTVFSGWSAVTFLYAPLAKAAPQFAELRLHRDTGVDGDGKTFDPTLAGVVTYAGSAIGGAVIEIDVDGDAQADAMAFATIGAPFTIKPQHLGLPLAYGVVSWRLRVGVFSDELSFRFSNWHDFSFEYEAEPAKLPLPIVEAHQVTAPSQLLSLGRDLEIAGSVNRSADDASIAFIRYDLDGDGVADGESPLSRSSNEFHLVIDPRRLPAEASTIRVSTMRWSADPGDRIASDWLSVNIVLVSAPGGPSIANLALVVDDGMPDDGVSTDPRIQGTLVVQEGSAAGKLIEIDIDGDFRADGLVSTDSTGHFQFDPRDFGLRGGQHTLHVRSQLVSAYSQGTVSTGWTPIEIKFDAPVAVAPTIVDLGLAVDTGEPGDGITAVPVIAGAVIAAGNVLSGVLVELDFHGDAKADKRYSVSPDTGAFQVTIPSGQLLVGENTVRFRTALWDSDSLTYLFSEWTSFTFHYAPASAAPASFQGVHLINDTGEQDNHTTDPRIAGVVTWGSGNVDALPVQYDLNGDNIPDGTVSTAIDGSGAFVLNLQPNSIPAGPVGVRLRVATPSGGSFVYGEWQDAFAFVLEVAANPTLAPTIGGLHLSEDSGTVGDLVTSKPRVAGTIAVPPGNTQSFAVQYDLEGDGQPDGITFSDAQGNFEINLTNRILLDADVHLQIRAGYQAGADAEFIFGEWTAFDFRFERDAFSPYSGGPSGGSVNDSPGNSPFSVGAYPSMSAGYAENSFVIYPFYLLNLDEAGEELTDRPDQAFTRYATRFNPPTSTLSQSPEPTISVTITYVSYNGTYYKVTTTRTSQLIVDQALTADGSWSIDESLVSSYTITYEPQTASPSNAVIAKAGTRSYQFHAEGDSDSAEYALTEQRSDSYDWSREWSWTTGGATESADRAESGEQQFTYIASGVRTLDTDGNWVSQEYRTFTAVETTSVEETLTRDDGSSDPMVAHWSQTRTTPTSLSEVILTVGDLITSQVEYSFTATTVTQAPSALLNLVEPNSQYHYLPFSTASGEYFPTWYYSAEGVRTEELTYTGEITAHRNSSSWGWTKDTSETLERNRAVVEIDLWMDYHANTSNQYYDETETVVGSTLVEGTVRHETLSEWEVKFDAEGTETTSRYVDDVRQVADCNFHYVTTTTRDLYLKQRTITDTATTVHHERTETVYHTPKQGPSEATQHKWNQTTVDGSYTEVELIEQGTATPGAQMWLWESSKISATISQIQDQSSGTRGPSSAQNAGSYSSQTSAGSRDYVWISEAGFSASGSSRSASSVLMTYSSGMEEKSNGFGKQSYAANVYSTTGSGFGDPRASSGSGYIDLGVGYAIALNQSHQEAQLTGNFDWSSNLQSKAEGKSYPMAGVVMTLDAEYAYSDKGMGTFQSTASETIANQDPTTRTGSALSSSLYNGTTHATSFTETTTAGLYSTSPGVTTKITMSSSASSYSDSTYKGKSLGTGTLLGLGSTAKYETEASSTTNIAYESERMESYSTVDRATSVVSKSSSTLEVSDEGDTIENSATNTLEEWTNGELVYSQAKVTSTTHTTGETKSVSISHSEAKGTTVSGYETTTIDNSSDFDTTREGKYAHSGTYEETVTYDVTAPILEVKTYTETNVSTDDGESKTNSKSSSQTDVEENDKQEGLKRRSYVKTTSKSNSAGTDSSSKTTTTVYSSVTGQHTTVSSKYSTTEKGHRESSTLSTSNSDRITEFSYGGESAYGESHKLGDKTKSEVEEKVDFEYSTSGESETIDYFTTSVDREESSESGTYSFDRFASSWSDDRSWGRYVPQEITWYHNYPSSHSDSSVGELKSTQNGNGNFSSESKYEKTVVGSVTTIKQSGESKRFESGNVTRSQSRTETEDRTVQPGEQHFRHTNSRSTYTESSTGQFTSYEASEYFEVDGARTSHEKNSQTEFGTRTLKQTGLNTTTEHKKEQSASSGLISHYSTTSQTIREGSGTYETSSEYYRDTLPSGVTDTLESDYEKSTLSGTDKVGNSSVFEERSFKLIEYPTKQWKTVFGGGHSNYDGSGPFSVESEFDSYKENGATTSKLTTEEQSTVTFTRESANSTTTSVANYEITIELKLDMEECKTGHEDKNASAPGGEGSSSTTDPLPPDAPDKTKVNWPAPEPPQMPRPPEPGEDPVRANLTISKSTETRSGSGTATSTSYAEETTSPSAGSHQSGTSQDKLDETGTFTLTSDTQTWSRGYARSKQETGETLVFQIDNHVQETLHLPGEYESHSRDDVEWFDDGVVTKSERGEKESGDGVFKKTRTDKTTFKFHKGPGSVSLSVEHTGETIEMEERSGKRQVSSLYEEKSDSSDYEQFYLKEETEFHETQSGAVTVTRTQKPTNDQDLANGTVYRLSELRVDRDYSAIDETTSKLTQGMTVTSMETYQEVASGSSTYTTTATVIAKDSSTDYPSKGTTTKSSDGNSVWSSFLSDFRETHADGKESTNRIERSDENGIYSWVDSETQTTSRDNTWKVKDDAVTNTHGSGSYERHAEYTAKSEHGGPTVYGGYLDEVLSANSTTISTGIRTVARDTSESDGYGGKITTNYYLHEGTGSSERTLSSKSTHTSILENGARVTTGEMHQIRETASYLTGGSSKEERKDEDNFEIRFDGWKTGFTENNSVHRTYHANGTHTDEVEREKWLFVSEEVSVTKQSKTTSKSDGFSSEQTRFKAEQEEKGKAWRFAVDDYALDEKVFQWKYTLEKFEENTSNRVDDRQSTGSNKWSREIRHENRYRYDPGIPISPLISLWGTSEVEFYRSEIYQRQSSSQTDRYDSQNQVIEGLGSSASSSTRTVDRKVGKLKGEEAWVRNEYYSSDTSESQDSSPQGSSESYTASTVNRSTKVEFDSEHEPYFTQYKIVEMYRYSGSDSYGSWDSVYHARSNLSGTNTVTVQDNYISSSTQYGQTTVSSGGGSFEVEVEPTWAVPVYQEMQKYDDFAGIKGDIAMARAGINAISTVIQSAVYGDAWNLFFASTEAPPYGPATGPFDWIGQNVVIPWVGEERLLKGDGFLDNLLIAGLLATEIAGYIDPTPISDIANAGLNAIDGNYLDASLSLAGALIPGGADKATKATSKVGAKVLNGLSAAGKTISKHTACDAPTLVGRIIGKTLGRCFVGDTEVVVGYCSLPDDGEPAENEAVANWIFRGGLTTVSLVGLAVSAAALYGTRSGSRRQREADGAELHDVIFGDEDSFEMEVDDCDWLWDCYDAQRQLTTPVRSGHRGGGEL